MASRSRPASHAGSWYTSKPRELEREIAAWTDTYSPPICGRFLVGPHAGYAYCGSVLAKSYAALDKGVKRVIVMGPSHYEHFEGVRTSQFASYDTPLGPLAVDKSIVARFRDAGFEPLNETTEVEEHGIEMHAPFIKYHLPEAQIVPLVFGSVRKRTEQQLLSLLQPYFADPGTALVVSSDFCHWGRRFGFTSYTPAPTKSPWDQNSISRLGSGDRPVWQSIKELDHYAMAIAATGDGEAWSAYIKKTKNTICGQRPLGVLLKLGEQEGKPLNFQWLDYAQSSKATSASDSSVSYAAGVST